jgi:putative SOS response-associated peptidase YedK
MAIVRQEDWQDWLQGEVAAERILRPLPAGSLKVSGPPVRATGDLFG